MDKDSLHFYVCKEDYVKQKPFANINLEKNELEELLKIGGVTD